MKVFIPCEVSQAVCKEFRNLGHKAYSCDILPCVGGHPELHSQGDARKYFNEGWDMMIAFPPCTNLAVSGARWFKEKQKDGRQQEGIDFFMEFTKTNIPKWAIENPIGIMSRLYRKPDCIIQPYRFGDNFQKSTCLWLHNLPVLQSTHSAEPLFGNSVNKGEFVTFKSGKKMAVWYASLRTKKDRASIRSKTFSGIAKAMAEQWGKGV